MLVKKFLFSFFFFLLLIPVTPKLGYAGDGIFEDYKSEHCTRVTRLIYFRDVVSCTTGQYIRTELLRDVEVTTTWNRQYCDGGLGWCVFGDDDCGPAQTTQQVHEPTVCE